MPLTKGFKELLKNLESEYLGKKVDKKYRKQYGKIYDKKDIKSFGYALAKSRGIKIDKKGQTMPLAILSSLAVLIVGLLFVNFLMPEITNARTDLSCSSASTIHDGAKILCLITDSVVPYFIIVIFSIITGVIVNKNG
ncbi:hypothetical protein KY342_00130 [Candidatus Woesearchaeota archaeon]|nr:hypothetical protein [Candidatus Woesearchaeota archaeon]